MNNIKICVYTAITEDDQYGRYSPSPWRRCKSVVRCALDRLSTRFTGRLALSDFHYLQMTGRRDNSNRGDIGIRIAVRERLTAAFTPRQVEFVELSWGSLDGATIEEINRSCDLFVIAGGGYIFIDAEGRPGYRLTDVPLLTQITCPVVAYGIGLNRLMHEVVRELDGLPEPTAETIAELGGACRMVGVRDADTQELLRLHSRRGAALIGDPALFLAGGVNGVRSARGGKPVIGLNLAAHGWRTIIVLQQVLPDVLEFLRAVVREYEPELVYFLHHDLEWPVVAHLRGQGFRFRVVDSEPAEMIREYAGLDFHICQMLHSCIFAANAETPFLNIAYDSKSVAFAALLGMPECAVPGAEAKAPVLKARFDEAYRRRAELSAAIRRRKAELNVETEKFLAEMAGLVGAPADRDQAAPALIEVTSR